MAYAEMSLILARIFWLYDIRLRGSICEGHTSLGRGWESINEFQTWDGFTSTREGSMVEFRRRP